MEAVGMFIQILAYVLIAAVILRIVFSWIGFDPSNPIYTVIHEITEPILGPIRSVMPRMGMFDFSPLVATILLGFIAQLGAQLAAS